MLVLLLVYELLGAVYCTLLLLFQLPLTKNLWQLSKLYTIIMVEFNMHRYDAWNKIGDRCQTVIICDKQQRLSITFHKQIVGANSGICSIGSGFTLTDGHIGSKATRQRLITKTILHLVISAIVFWKCFWNLVALQTDSEHLQTSANGLRASRW